MIAAACVVDELAVSIASRISLLDARPLARRRRPFWRMGDVGGEAAACAAAGVDLVLLERGLTIELSGGGVLCGSATAGWLKPASSAGGAACFSAEVLLRVRRGGVALRGAAVAAASGSAGGSDSSPSCDSRPRRSMLRAVAPERGCGLRAWLRPPSAGVTLAVSAHCADKLFAQRDRDRPNEARAAAHARGWIRVGSPLSCEVGARLH